MKTPWPVVILAVGLAFLFASISLVYGAAVASAVVGGAGIAYVALNVLLGKKKDDATASQMLRRIFSVSKTTYAAAAIVWLGALAIVAVPRADRALSAEFTIRVVDEGRQPVEGARVDIRFDGGWRPVPLEHGVGRVTYYPRSTAAAALVRIRYRGSDRTIPIRMDADRHYADLVIPVWSGEAMVSVTHLTVAGMAMEPALRGVLPDELRPRFPRVIVLRNPVVDTAREVLQLYRLAHDPASLVYLRSERDRSAPARRTRRETASRADRALEAYLRRVRSRQYPQTLYSFITMDFSRDILGAPADQPLPAGFVAALYRANREHEGTYVLPDAVAEAWIGANVPDIARGSDGSVSMHLERLVDARVAAALLDGDHFSGDHFSAAYEAEARRYLRYMLRRNLPAGLIGGRVEFYWNGCGEDEAPRFVLELPPPVLRVTLLKNSGARPISISEIVLTMQQRSGLQRATTQAPTRQIATPFDQLEPGETLLIPREVSVRAVHRDSEVAAFRRRPRQPIARLQLPLPPDRRPAAIMLSEGQLRVRGDPAVSPAEDDEARAGLGQAGPSYFLGPSVGEIDYVVNGVRMRARSDRHTVIAMIGGIEVGSCPFVFAHYRPGTAPLNLGQIIRNRVGFAARGRDRVAIPRGFRALEIRELEDEVSYLDGVWLIVRSARGERRYPALNRHLGAEDGRFAVLRRGDSLPLRFGHIPSPGDGQVSLEVSGYYDLVRPGEPRGTRRPRSQRDSR